MFSFFSQYFLRTYGSSKFFLKFVLLVNNMYLLKEVGCDNLSAISGEAATTSYLPAAFGRRNNAPVNFSKDKPGFVSVENTLRPVS